MTNDHSSTALDRDDSTDAERLERVRVLAHQQVTSGGAYERLNQIREALDLPSAGSDGPPADPRDLAVARDIWQRLQDGRDAYVSGGSYRIEVPILDLPRIFGVPAEEMERWALDDCAAAPDLARVSGE